MHLNEQRRIKPLNYSSQQGKVIRHVCKRENNNNYEKCENEKEIVWFY